MRRLSTVLDLKRYAHWANPRPGSKHSVRKRHSSPNQIPNDEPILAQLSAGNWTEAKLLLSQLPESRRKLLLQTRLDTEEGRLSEATTTLMLARAKPLGSTLADRATESEAWELEHRLKLLTCGRLRRTHRLKKDSSEMSARCVNRSACMKRFSWFKNSNKVFRRTPRRSIAMKSRRVSQLKPTRRCKQTPTGSAIAKIRFTTYLVLRRDAPLSARSSGTGEAIF